MFATKHYVVFYSPGTFFCESSSKPIDSWDTKEAVRISKDIKERYNAKPYGFQFESYLESGDVTDEAGNTLQTQPKRTKVSGMHYLGGKLLKRSDIPDTKENYILRSNMRSRPVCIENTNSYKFTGEFEENACIVNDNGDIIRRGNDKDLVAYRKKEKENG